MCGHVFVDVIDDTNYEIRELYTEKLISYMPKINRYKALCAARMEEFSNKNAGTRN
jgi:hypothetical protein